MLLRLRRYRVFLVFAAITLIALYHFTTVSDWEHVRAASVDTLKHWKGQYGGAPDGATPAADQTESEKKPDGGKDTKPSVDEKLTLIVGDTLPTHKPEADKGRFGKFGMSNPGRLEAPEELPTDDFPPIHYEHIEEHFPIPSESLIPLPTGRPAKIPKIQYSFGRESSSAKAARLEKLEKIKESFMHSWSGYKERAWGQDELTPVTGEARNPFNGWGASLVDALDTLVIMDLQGEFDEAAKEVEKIDFSHSARKDIPIFETTIRYLGGLLSAHDVSNGKHPVFLKKAKELANIMMDAFDTPNRMPVLYYYWMPEFNQHPHRAGTRDVMSELGSLSVEFTRLSQLTKDNKYYDAIARITLEFQQLQNRTKLSGLWPQQIDASGCRKPEGSDPLFYSHHGEYQSDQAFVGHDISHKADEFKEKSKDSTDEKLRKRQIDTDSVKTDVGSGSQNGIMLEYNPEPAKVNCEAQPLESPPDSTWETFGLGGQSDSTYEYLLKEYLLLGGREAQYQEMYEMAIDTAEHFLLFRPMIKDEKRDILVAGAVDVLDGKEGPKMILKAEQTHLACFTGGMWAIGSKVFGRKKDLETAAKLTEGCVWSYEMTNTGIMPERFNLLPCASRDSCKWNQTRWYESLDPYRSAREMSFQQAPLSEPANPSEAEIIPASEVEQKEERGPGLVTEELTKEEVEEEKKEHAHKKRQIGGVDHDKDIKAKDEEVDWPHVPSEEYKLPTHEEYVEERIKNERLPEGVEFIPSKHYILRPEAIESVFIMYRVTGDETWREKGWKMFQAIEKYTRAEYGHSAIGDVTDPETYKKDEMESFWLAETLKYFYLLFSEPDHMSLDEYVFNTEAHPMKRE